MWMSPFDTRFFSQAHNQMAQAVGIKRVIATVNKYWCFWIIAVFALSQVAPHRPAGALADEYCAPFATLCAAFIPVFDHDLTVSQIRFTDFQTAEFGCPQTGIQQEEDHCLVALSRGSTSDEAMPVVGLYSRE